jgi:hypothetical protein
MCRKKQRLEAGVQTRLARNVTPQNRSVLPSTLGLKGL